MISLRKIFVILISCLAILGGVIIPIHAASAIDARAAMMVDADTGQVIYEQDADKQLPVASVSKLLTIAVIHDELRKNIITADTRVPVTPAIAAISNDPTYSSIGLAVGQSYSVIELLNAAMVKSADGATLALATAAGSSPDEFVLAMEKKAREIGLKKTRIINPTGLTNDEMKSFRSPNIAGNAENAMSARDVAILTRYLVRHYPALLQVTAQKKANFLITKGNVKRIANLNKMLPGGQYSVLGVTITGLKTGTSDKAGACFVSTGEYRGHQIITVVLHANGNNPDNRFVQTQRLYAMLKHDYRLEQVHLPQDVRQAAVTNGARRTVATRPTSVTIWGTRHLTSYTAFQELNPRLIDDQGRLRAPVRNHQCVGRLCLTSPQLKTVSGAPLTYPLRSAEAVPQGNFLQRLFN